MPPIVKEALPDQALRQDWEYLELEPGQLGRMAQRALDQAKIREGLETGELMVTSTGLSIQRFTRIGDRFIPQGDSRRFDLENRMHYAIGEGENADLFEADLPIRTIWSTEAVPIYASGPTSRQFSIRLIGRMKTEVGFPWCGGLGTRPETTDTLVFNSTE